MPLQLIRAIATGIAITAAARVKKCFEGKQEVVISLANEIKLFDYLTDLYRRRNIEEENSRDCDNIRMKQEKHERMLSLINSVGFNANYRSDTTKRTLLMQACLSQQLGIVSRLLDHGAKVNLTDKDGNTALICALASSTIGESSWVLYIVDELLQHGANPNYVNNKNRTALYYSFKRDPYNTHEKYKYDLKIIEKLLKYNADPNVQLPGQFKFFLHLLENGNIEFAQLLLKSGYITNDSERARLTEELIRRDANEYNKSQKKTVYTSIGNTFICPECQYRAKVGVICKCGKLYSEIPW